MNTARRWYIYLVVFIALQGVAWAIIALLRNLFIFGGDPTAVAFQIAVIIIGTPVFLGHWIWGQRLADRDEEEKGSAVRRLYLYASLAAFLGPFLTNTYDLLGSLLLAPGTVERRSRFLTRMVQGDAILYHLLAMVILALFWFYHQRITRRESGEVPENENAATIRRLYIFGFSAGGLALVTMAVIHLSRWVMIQFSSGIASTSHLYVGLSDEITRLVIGVPLWIVFWRWADFLYRSPDPEEKGSVLRKFYLNAAVYAGAIGVVANLTAILASVFRRLLGLASQGDIRQPLPNIIGMGVLWAFHAYVIREENKDGQTPEQAGVLRLYRYLTASIGYLALLIGVGGVLSVVIRSLDRGFIGDVREQLAWFAAGLIAGLPVWLIPFRILQAQVSDTGPEAGEARRSLPRKIYLYFFLFIGVLTVLSSGVFIVFRIIGMFLGEDPITLNELGHALAFTLIAVLNWVFHQLILRSDRRRSEQQKLGEVQELKIVVLDRAPGAFGQALVHALGQEIPGLAITPTILPAPVNGEPVPAEAGEAETGQAEAAALQESLAQAGLVVGSWEFMAAGDGGSPLDEAVAGALAASPARKLLIPTPREGLDWIGVRPADTQSIARQAAEAVQQIIEGGAVQARKPLGCAGIAGIIVGIVILLSLVGWLAGSFLSYLF